MLLFARLSENRVVRCNTVQCIVTLEAALYYTVLYCTVLYSILSSVVKASIGEVLVREGGVDNSQVITVILICYH